jgi:hypothetical protein
VLGLHTVEDALANRRNGHATAKTG